MAQGNSEAITAWQWYCRGYRKKRGSLHQYIQRVISEGDARPDVVAIQEAGCDATLPSYKAHFPLATGRLSPHSYTLTAVQHDTDDPRTKRIPYAFIELLPRKQGENGLFILNVYSKPSDTRANFDYLFHIATMKAGGCPLPVVGDFKAGLTEWNYAKDSVQGKALSDAALQADLTIINDLSAYTRIGSRGQANTNPDLTLVRGAPDGKWSNTDECLGSDHCVLAIPLTANALTFRHKPVTMTH